MKNYVIGFLLISLAVLGSYFYKGSLTSHLDFFPIENSAKRSSNSEPLLYLYIFFSKNNCSVCLEVIDVLNELPPQFVVTGIVPGEELKNETELRNISRAAFNLIVYKSSYKKFIPNYSPSIFGVSSTGKVLFILPAIPNEKEYLYDFLANLYSMSIELLIQQPTTKKNGHIP